MPSTGKDCAWWYDKLTSTGRKGTLKRRLLTDGGLLIARLQRDFVNIRRGWLRRRCPKIGFREPGNGETVLARSNSGKLASPRSSKSRDRPDRLAHVPTQSFNVASCAWSRSQGAAGTLAACRYSNNHEISTRRPFRLHCERRTARSFVSCFRRKLPRINGPLWPLEKLQTII
jgi:hypothetical protein